MDEGTQWTGEMDNFRYDSSEHTNGYWKLRYLMQLQCAKAGGGAFVQMLTTPEMSVSMKWEAGVANYLGLPFVAVRCTSSTVGGDHIVGGDNLIAAVRKAISSQEDQQVSIQWS